MQPWIQHNCQCGFTSPFGCLIRMMSSIRKGGGELQYAHSWQPDHWGIFMSPQAPHNMALAIRCQYEWENTIPLRQKSRKRFRTLTLMQMDKTSSQSHPSQMICVWIRAALFTTISHSKVIFIDWSEELRTRHLVQIQVWPIPEA